MATNSETSGILFVFEADGSQWAAHLADLLQSEPYKIPCVTEHWWNLTSRLAETHPVHVLLLSPLMEANIAHQKFSHLRNDSDTSLLLECNVDSTVLKMSRWLLCEKVDTSLEKQRQLLVTLVDMYEMAINHEETFDKDDYVNIDIVPKTIYPGESTVFVLFSIEPAGEVSIKFQGIRNRIPAKKYTKYSYTWDVPEVGHGQKITSVFVEGIPYSVFTTSLVIVTSEALLENLMGNINNTMGIRRSDNLKSAQMMGLFFNPFSEFQCNPKVLKSFAQHIKVLPTDGPTQERDSGLGGENYYETIGGHEDKNKRRQGQFMADDSEFLTRSSRSNPEERSIERSKSSVFKKIWGNIFRKEANQKQKSRKLSRRSAKAHSHEVSNVPDLPPTNRKYSTTNNWLFQRKSLSPPQDNW